ncbi:hypothetical protein CVT25_008443 [Psilocybe cyanescens]|uniref:Uncharacterized protein n=1 Tax=Psilocybe cyanescens TaxID=93625 RepID=A0A409WUU2_PSICY|nr:hypothetical protein CVT25_008443 [Psilocybe cyanescens]
MAPTVTISSHTTASKPRAHIIYTINANIDGKGLTAHRRYSEFVTLHEALKDPYTLPPKRLLATTFIPSAWVDDELIAERKAGLAEYLVDLLSTPKYKDKSLLYEFLSAQTIERDMKFDPEDALPSTLTRKEAMQIAASEPSEGAAAAAANASMIAGAYYPSWSSNRPPENIDYSKFDLLFYAFGVPTSSNTLDISNTALLRRLVTAARSSGQGTRVVISIGGWGGCQYFSQACSTSANRTKFANSIASAINTYNLDGVDFDWEFPNSPGAGQPYSAADTANLLSLIKLLRISLGPCKIISAAVSHMPWLGSNGAPLTDVSAFAAEMDYLMIMNYDVWGASATPGPNAPYGNLCGTSWQPQASAQAAYKQWTAAKFPGNKLILGLPLYGYVSKSTKTVLTGSSVPSAEMLLLQKKEIKGPDGKVEAMEFLNGAHANTTPQATNPEAEAPAAAAVANLTGYWGKQIAFSDIVKAGALVKRSDGNYGQAGGFTMGWDNCSNTPYLFNKDQGTVVTYDDTWSLTDKAKLAVSSGMAGCATWSLDQDDGITLHNAIRKGLGNASWYDISLLFFALKSLISSFHFIEALGDGFALPPKHAILTAILPSGWLDDALIAERKIGLAKYLSALLWSPEYHDTPIIKGFFERDMLKPDENIDVEDVLPSTLTRKDVSAFFSLRDQVQELTLEEDEREQEQEEEPEPEPEQEEETKKELISAAYYPEWCAGTVPPESLDYGKFDVIFFGFATPNASSTLDWGRDTKSILKRMVASAKASGSGTKIALSIGGWNGSQWFSHLCASANNRVTFVQAVQTAVNAYGLDGIDLDWEFPNSNGAGNPYSSHDSANFLLLIQSLRSALGPAKIISAAVQHAPWAGADGVTLNDVSAYAESLSYINIMNYSVWGTSSPGPNAPLGQVVKNQRRVQTTAEAGLLRWKTAGFPPAQILLGLPLFGHVFKSKKTALNGGTPPSVADNILSFASHTFKGAHKAVFIKDLVKKPNSKGALAAWWGKPIAFKDIVASGALVKRFDGNYGHGDGFTLGWDDPSSTPYIFSVEKKTLITFDNTRSLAAKVKFAQENDLAGCCTWSLDQELLNTLLLRCFIIIPPHPLTSMSAINSVFIYNHTTSSTPLPHVVYIINVVRDNGSQYEVLRRYSEFVTLKENLGDSFPLPPKHALVTSFLPSAWIDNELIEERKRGLQMFLTYLLHHLGLRFAPDFLFFIGAGNLVVHDSRVWPSLALPEMTSKGSLASDGATSNEPERTTKPIAAAYYPSWASDTSPPHKIDFSKFDILFFAFATPNGDAGIHWDDGAQDVLRNLVSWGWSGCHWYSQAMSTEVNRSKLVKTLAETVDSYGLDGIDIDWEYPNSSGSGNPHSPEDAANLLSFFKALRNTLGNSKVISAAVTQLPWLGPNGSPLSNVAEYAKYMSFVNIMNYDVFSSSSHPGPNAPLSNISTKMQAFTPTYYEFKWTHAGMPASKLLLGLPLYGYVSKSADKKLSGSLLPSRLIHTIAHPKTKRSIRLSGAQGDLSKMWGQQIAFSQLVELGALNKKQDGSYCGANGYTMGWDDCSDTPFLFNVNRTTVVSYDDPFSIASKTSFAKKSGMGGCFTWSLDQVFIALNSFHTGNA